MKETIVALFLALILFKSIVKTVLRFDKRPTIKFFKENGFFNVLCSKDVVDDQDKHAYGCGCSKGQYVYKMIIGVCLFVFFFKVILLAIK